MPVRDTIPTMKKISDNSGIKIDLSEEPSAKIIPEETTVSWPVSAPQLVHDFLVQNKIKPKLEVVSELNVWDGSGTILNDKPLLKVTYEFIKE